MEARRVAFHQPHFGPPFAAKTRPKGEKEKGMKAIDDMVEGRLRPPFAGRRCEKLAGRQEESMHSLKCVTLWLSVGCRPVSLGFGLRMCPPILSLGRMKKVVGHFKAFIDPCLTSLFKRLHL